MAINNPIIAVSHFKHATFDALQYARVGIISKESLKRVPMQIKYFYHPSCVVNDAQFMTPLPADTTNMGSDSGAPVV